LNGKPFNKKQTQQMTSKPQAVIIKIEDFDLTQLPEAHRDTKAPGFRQVLKDYLKADYNSAGYFADIAVDDECIRIEQDVDATEQSELALEALQRGNYPQGKAILESLLPKYPMNAVVLYNLGMVYSDEGNLTGAIELLSKATQVNPKHAHAWVALAVAYMRKGDQHKALEAAKTAFKVAPDDPYVLRTAGSLTAQAGDTRSALDMLEKAVQTVPTDSIALYSLAECLRADNEDMNRQRSDELYKKVIELAPGSPQAERAKDRRREFAYEGFRKSGELRPDAVMYCLDALQKFNTMSQRETAGVAMEAATLGQSGLEVNNPDKKYQLRTLPGHYSGLNVVCILHTAVQQIAPGNDSGFDVQAEYEAALKLFDQQG
jgi:tetratricopeptide (TPR) repeat protein